MKRSVWVNPCLIFIALIWGIGFVPQKLGLDYLGASAFNAWRFAIGGLVLLPVLYLAGALTKRTFMSRSSLILSLVLGVLLFAGALMQQISLKYTTIANASFITGLYVILVPAMTIALGYRYKLIVLLGGLIAVIGLYLLTQGGTGLALKGDTFALIGAVFWALHLIVMSERSGQHDSLVLAFFQFMFCAFLSLVYALSFENNLIPNAAIGYLWPIVSGVIVVGIAYTLQVWVMDKAEPFAASIIFSLESVFGAIAAYFVFDQSLGVAGLLGAGLMLVGGVLAQLEEASKP